MSYLCCAIFVIDPVQVQRATALAAEQGADLVELRLDELDDPDVVRQVVSQSALPCIATCRSAREGGRSRLKDEQRFVLLAAARDAGAAYVDVEYEAFQSNGGLEGLGFHSPLVLSTHDFRGRPERLYNLLKRLQASAADIQKIVWMARNIRDNLEIFEILQQRTKPTIALCMGEAGLISRVLAKKFGAFLSFASLKGGGATADGQIPLREMKNLYRWDAIGQQTKVYGVVASPVAHSMSPAIHNAAFEAIDYDGVYLPLRVEAGYERFKAFMEMFTAFDGLDLSGLSITLPHKENALHYLKEKNAEVEPLAQRIGAVNTIVIDRSGPTPLLRGFNSDYPAILDSITSALNLSRDELRNRSVGVIGAGGTGRTAVAALTHHGAKVTVYNRTLQRAEALAEEFGASTGKWDALAQTRHDIYFNATSIGMAPHVDQSPFDRQPPFKPGDLVFDAVYNPIHTRLLRQADAAGAKTISGLEMFVRQAAAQFEAWTSQPAPVEVMRSVVSRRLK